MAPVDYIAGLTRTYEKLGYPPYKWVHSETPPPWTELRKPLAECRLGLIASGGIYSAGQVAFHTQDDTGIRAIPRDVPTGDLRTAHFAYDQTDARSDPNVVFPIDTLRNLVAEGVVGELASHAYTFMGGIYSARRVREDVAPALRQRMQDERVDLALLVPV